MRALSSRPSCPFDGRRVSLLYLSAGCRYTASHANTSACSSGSGDGQPVITEIERLDALTGQLAQGVVHAPLIN